MKDQWRNSNTQYTFWRHFSNLTNKADISQNINIIYWIEDSVRSYIIRKIIWFIHITEFHASIIFLSLISQGDHTRAKSHSFSISVEMEEGFKWCGKKKVPSRKDGGI